MDSVDVKTAVTPTGAFVLAPVFLALQAIDVPRHVPRSRLAGNALNDVIAKNVTVVLSKDCVLKMLVHLGTEAQLATAPVRQNSMATLARTAVVKTTRTADAALSVDTVSPVASLVTQGPSAVTSAPVGGSESCAPCSVIVQMGLVMPRVEFVFQTAPLDGLETPAKTRVLWATRTRLVGRSVAV